MRKLLSTAAIAAALLAAGCGSPSPEEQVANTANNYFQALGTGKFTTVCRMLTPESRRSFFAESMSMGFDERLDNKLKRIAKKYGGANSKVENEGCAKVIGVAIGSLSDQDRSQIAGFRFDPKDIKVRGTTAKIHDLSGDTISFSSAQLIRFGSKWLVDIDTSEL